jgi:hypothetical protein
LSPIFTLKTEPQRWSGYTARVETPPLVSRDIRNTRPDSGGAEFPSDPPKKWRDERCNTVQVRLRAGSVQALEIRGFLISPILDLKILRDGELLRVQGATGGISIDIASEILDVGSDNVSAYVNDPSW